MVSVMSAGIATAQWLGLRLQLIAALLVTLVGVMAVAGNEDILPGFHGAGDYTASKFTRLCFGFYTTSKSSTMGVDVWYSLFESELATCSKQCITPRITNCALKPAVTAPGHTTWHAGLLGLSLSYALPITGLLSAVLSSSAETEQEMVSVERIQVSIVLSNTSSLCDKGLPERVSQPPGLVAFHQRHEICRNTVSWSTRPHSCSLTSLRWVHLRTLHISLRHQNRINNGCATMVLALRPVLLPLTLISLTCTSDTTSKGWPP